MTEYALIFNSDLAEPYVADQLQVMDCGYNYIEGEPCVRIDTSKIQSYSLKATVKNVDHIVGQFDSKLFQGGECFLIPLKLIKSEVHQGDLIIINICYEQSIKTTVDESDVGFCCFGTIKVYN